MRWLEAGHCESDCGSGSDGSSVVCVSGASLGIDELVVSSAELAEGAAGSEPSGAQEAVCGVSEAGSTAASQSEEETWVWSESDDLPRGPQQNWKPELSIWQWAEKLFMMLPLPLRLWVEQVELQDRWQNVWQSQGTVLPLLQTFAKQFDAGSRRGAIKWLFQSRGFLGGQQSGMFEDLFCGFPKEFGFIQFGVREDTAAVKFVMSLADCFLSLVDDRGFSSSLFWAVEPRVQDPVDFKAGGVHSAAAQEAWDRLPGVSSHVRHWVHNKVWFKKKEHVIDRSARNAPELSEGSSCFDKDKFDFLDKKIGELLRCGAVVQLPVGVLPDVLTRLSLAPKPGSGPDKWRVIMDMRPENSRHFQKKVRMEHLAHFSSVFSPDMLLFSLDLKSAYFSVSVTKE